MKTYLNALEDVSHFLKHQGHVEQVIELGSTIDNIVNLFETD